MPELAAKVDPLQPYQSFEVSRYSDYFMLKFSDRSPFAQVSELISRGLEMLQQYHCVEMRAFAETKRIQHVLSRAKRPGEANMKVEINIYGSIADADAIGNNLCFANVYLQDPDHGTQDIEYCNPHVIEFPGFEEPKPLNRGQAFFAESWGPSKIVREEREKFNDTVSSIYQSLTRPRNLKRMKGGTHILTPLLPYVLTSAMN
jgi:hypothetical protein